LRLESSIWNFSKPKLSIGVSSKRLRGVKEDVSLERKRFLYVQAE